MNNIKKNGYTLIILANLCGFHPTCPLKVSIWQTWNLNAKMPPY